MLERRYKVGNSLKKLDNDHLKKWIPEMLRGGQSVWLETSGFSMYPTLKPTDKLKVEPKAIENVVPGEIVVFVRESRMVVHRAVSVSNDHSDIVIKAKGDSVWTFDEPVTKSNYLGIVYTYTSKDVEVLVEIRTKFVKLRTLYCWGRKTLKIFGRRLKGRIKREILGE